MGAWRPLPSMVEAATDVLTASTDHLSDFDIDVQSWQAAQLPRIAAFQVASFTGAATYSLPLWAPPGPGGLQPELELSYNSQAVDSATLRTQASWVGMGWSLETGYILRDIHGSDGGEDDDTFTLNVAGVGSLMLPRKEITATTGSPTRTSGASTTTRRPTPGKCGRWTVRNTRSATTHARRTTNAATIPAGEATADIPSTPTCGRWWK
jgi:hypothetical protein